VVDHVYNRVWSVEIGQRPRRCGCDAVPAAVRRAS
jgi:hypothetical protein